MKHVLLLIAISTSLAGLSGCSSPVKSTDQYPITQMLDPVTKETPNVVTNLSR